MWSLKLLKECGLIVSERQGQRAVHSLADDNIITLISIIHSIAIRNLPEIDRLLASRYPDRPPEEIRPEQLSEYLERGNTKVFDLRPSEEYETGHVPGAVSANRESLQQVEESDGDEVCIIYCRNKYCLSLTTAEKILRSKGYQVKHLTGGFPSWRMSRKKTLQA